jgi:predicted enzyme related to lactoylglutathione lyase
MLHGVPCWYELASTDLTKSQAFYTALLDWHIADSGTPGMDYRVATLDGSMIAGFMTAAEGQPEAWGIYFATADCDTTAAAAMVAGATTVVPPSDIPGTGRFSLLIDPQGAFFGLLQPLPGGTGGAFDQTKPGHGNWHELITQDPAAALAFYGALFGWVQSATVPMGADMTYHIFAVNGQDIGGTCAMPGMAAHWTPYFGVASVAAMVAKVTEAGGTVVHGPDQVPGGAFTLQIKDSQGAAVAVVGPA